MWRDGRTLFILFAMPLAQILIFGFALTNEVKNTRIGIVDPSQDVSSRAVTDRLESSRYFEVLSQLPDAAAVDEGFRRGKIRMAVVFPPDFHEKLMHGNEGIIQLIADASDPNVANTLVNYATAVIMDYQRELPGYQDLPYTIRTETRMLYNPQLKGSYSFVPGVMAMVLLLVCSMMTSISIVREKEIGTMEVILVSPIVPIRVVLAKMVPYLILSVVNIISILLLSVFVLDVPIQGNLALLMAECILFTMTSLAVGLLISTVTDSMQTAMLASLMGMFLPTIMLSGFMFPIENMPLPLRVISHIVPSRWFYYIVKNVMIKGVDITHVWKETLILTGMLVFFLTVSIRKFKTRLE